MNIFVLSSDPVQAAEWHIDAHVRKMILESAQMLCNAVFMDPTQCPDIFKDEEGNPNPSIARQMTKEEFQSHWDFPMYRPTHVNHPCSVWVRESIAHRWWLFQLADVLNEEYRVRFDKPHNHSSWDVINGLPLFTFSDHCDGYGSPRVFAVAMPDRFRGTLNFADPNLAESFYQVYYSHAKIRDKNGRRIDIWTGRERPPWFPEPLEDRSFSPWTITSGDRESDQSYFIRVDPSSTSTSAFGNYVYTWRNA